VPLLGRAGLAKLIQVDHTRRAAPSTVDPDGAASSAEVSVALAIVRAAALLLQVVCTQVGNPAGTTPAKAALLLQAVQCSPRASSGAILAAGH
jgi:hypothetical protein